MKLDQLRYFLEAARHEHLGRAAKVLHLSPSTVSHAIAALESDLGCALFDNQGKRVVLTDHGRRLVELGDELLAHAERVRESLNEDPDAAAGYFRLAATHGLSGAYLTPAWQAQFGANPRITAQIYSLRSAEVVAQAARREIDLGLCYSPLAHPDVHKEVVHEGQLTFAVRAKHPVLRLAEDARLAALSGYPAVLAKAFQGIDNCERHPAFAKLRATPRPSVVFDSYETAAAACAESDAWTFLPEWIALADERLRPLVAKAPPAPYEVALVWPRGRAKSRVAKALVDELRERFATNKRR
jgi:LysR family cyn operon transcriptional activator